MGISTGQPREADPAARITYGLGTIFELTPSGTWTMLYAFGPGGGVDGGGPNGLIQATDGNFYGTTYEFGDNGGPGGAGYGTVFQFTPSGTLTTLYNFCPLVYEGICPDGNHPVAGLVQATNGNFLRDDQPGREHGYL
jgi:hypothetical protein